MSTKPKGFSFATLIDAHGVTRMYGMQGTISPRGRTLHSLGYWRMMVDRLVTVRGVCHTVSILADCDPQLRFSRRTTKKYSSVAPWLCLQQQEGSTPTYVKSPRSSRISEVVLQASTVHGPSLDMHGTTWYDWAGHQPVFLSGKVLRLDHNINGELRMCLVGHWLANRIDTLDDYLQPNT